MKEECLLPILLLALLIGFIILALFQTDNQPNCQKSSTHAIEIQGELKDYLICEEPLKILKVYEK